MRGILAARKYLHLQWIRSHVILRIEHGDLGMKLSSYDDFCLQYKRSLCNDIFIYDMDKLRSV